MDIIDVVFIVVVTSIIMNIFLIIALWDETKLKNWYMTRFQECIDEMHSNPFNYSK